MFNIEYGLFHPNISKLKFLNCDTNCFKFVTFVENEIDLQKV